MNLLVVTKLPTIERYTDAQLQRLREAGIDRDDELERGRQAHHDSYQHVMAVLEKRGIAAQTTRVDDLDSCVSDDLDLVITVGGDGTVLAANSLLHGVPVLAVNSDPERSLGHFTRCHAKGFADLYDGFCAGTAGRESVARLQVQHGHGQALPFLNECLITNRNPSLMSRYQLTVDGVCEHQASSGIWISTPAGSTGAIASAGLQAQPELDDALLFKVREPFQRKQPLRLLEGIQDPPRGLDIITTVPGMGCYIDGGYHHDLELDIGEHVKVRPSDDPLLLVTAPA